MPSYPNEQRENIVSKTHGWIGEFVAKLNICPFAAGPLARSSVWYRVSQSVETNDVYRDFLQALDEFVRLPVEQAETGLFIMPDALAVFDDYLAFLELAEAALEPAGLVGLIQLASFHPDYVFADVDPDDPANLTNRSPYPMLHFIREDELEKALAGYPDPESIPERNVALLRGMRPDQLAEVRRWSRE